MPLTLQTTALQPISFTVNSLSSTPTTKAVTLSSANAGNLVANAGTGKVAVGNTYVGNFTSTSISASTQYVLTSGLPTKGTFKWNLTNCGSLTTCSSGGFTYTPNSNSAGQTEIIQFQVRDTMTLNTSAATTYSIEITNKTNGGALGPLALLFLCMIFGINRRKLFIR